MSISAPFIKSADLAGAIAALTAEVKKKPADIGVRFELAECLMLSGNLDRADNHLDIVMNQDTSWGMIVAMLRQLIRGLISRDEVFMQGRSPEFLGAPTDTMQALLKAGQALRQNDLAQAAALCAEAEAARPTPKGTCNGKPFDDFRDADDMTAGIFEVLTSNGKYYWVATEAVNSMIFRPIEKPRDLILRPVEMDIQDGPEGLVFIPSSYWRPADVITDAERLGHMTDWSDDAGPVRGMGQRCFLVGEDSLDMSEFDEVEFTR
jgi:type VI secretion system protein ImpE